MQNSAHSNTNWTVVCLRMVALMMVTIFSGGVASFLMWMKDH